MANVRVTGPADEIELIARSFGAAPRMQRRRDGMMAGYFEVHAPKIICLDLGTTGSNPVEDEIVAIAIVGWAGNVLHEGKYRPSRKELWQAASEVNGVAREPYTRRRRQVVQGALLGPPDLYRWAVGIVQARLLCRRV